MRHQYRILWCIYGKSSILQYSRSNLSADTMSFSASTYQYDHNGYNTNVIAEVAKGSPTILKCSSGTYYEEFTFVNTWSVRGLKTLGEQQTRILSAPFTHQNYSIWRLVLRKRKDGLYLYFLLEKCQHDAALGAKLKACEILPNGEKREVFPCKWCVLMEGRESEGQLVRKAGTVEEENSGDKITLQCEVCMQCVIQDELPEAHTAELQTDVVRAIDEMLHKEVHTDFELHTGGTTLKAHKAVLSVRSPYFAAMLQPHTKEAEEGRVEVSDVKPEVMEQVLLFMYTGGAPALEEMPWDLLIAADKYQLQQLKRRCEAHIANCLTVDNAAETAANASVFSCDVLWDRAVLFIKRNLLQVMRTPGWAVAITSHPEAVQRISELMG